MNTDSRTRGFRERNIDEDRALIARIDNGESWAGNEDNDAPPASDKQVGFVQSLIAERELSDEFRADATKQVAEGLTIPAASTLIERLQDQPKREREGFRFTKHDGTWAVKGAGEPGQHVEVNKADDTTKTVTLGEQLAPNVFAIADDRRERRDDEPEAGMYRNDEGTILRVYLGQQSGRMLMKQVVRNEREDGYSYRYIGAAAHRMSGLTRMSLAEAKRWGKMTGHCCVCARRLDVPESVEAGIGPVCAGRLA